MSSGRKSGLQGLRKRGHVRRQGAFQVYQDIGDRMVKGDAPGVERLAPEAGKPVLKLNR
jgi:hypothetical protein